MIGTFKDEVGKIAWQLRPGILDDLGLVKALTALKDDLEQRTGARIDLRVTGPVGYSAASATSRSTGSRRSR